MLVSGVWVVTCATVYVHTRIVSVSVSASVSASVSVSVIVSVRC